MEPEAWLVFWDSVAGEKTRDGQKPKAVRRVQRYVETSFYGSAAALTPVLQ
jgi:hypothetical protein